MTASTAFAANPEITDSPATRALREGLDHVTAGRIGEAIATFKHGLADAEADAKIIAELHFKLGNAGMTLGDLDLAAENYSAALRLQPEMTPCWCNLGSVYLKWHRAKDAVALYLHALSLDPLHWPSRTNLVQALIATRQITLAKLLLLELNTERPRDAQLCHQLGKLHADDDELEAAFDCFRRAVSLRPDDADSFYGIGNVLQKMDDRAGAEAAFLQAARLQPLIRRPAAQSPAAFRVLALFAPFAGNTPTEYLLTSPAYDANTLAVFDGRNYDIDMLRQNADVVFNQISDADQAQALLTPVAELIDRLGLPTVNPPDKIRQTAREIITRRLKDIPGCRLPKVLRLPADISSITALEAAATFAMPVLARPAGTHGGDDFEKFGNLSEVARFVQHHPGVEHYLIEYLDYRSADGHFRKYRFIFVGDEILPYHLAIGTDWKLHHDNTDMINHAWMQREEEDFLTDPWAVFDPNHYDALRAIRNIVDLDYFGIDCGLDATGQIVVFEVNASMLVHQHNENFPYKALYVERIRLAFDAMLEKMTAAGD
jgi:Flp pilus assembly protein TadD/glutathione synthase/RimK-type ligase-like ATP-grasp enzyme